MQYHTEVKSSIQVSRLLKQLSVDIAEWIYSNLTLVEE